VTGKGIDLEGDIYVVLDRWTSWRLAAIYRLVTEEELLILEMEQASEQAFIDRYFNNELFMTGPRSLRPGVSVFRFGIICVRMRERGI
jgi:hypothetical protein